MIDLIETIPVRGGKVEADRLGRHLARLARSAAALGLVHDGRVVRATVARALAAAGPVDLVLRVLLATDGTVGTTCRALPGPTRLVRLALDSRRTDTSDPGFGHKTSAREVFDEAFGRRGDADDVVLVNTEGRITETTIANLAVRLGGVWCTPPVSDGCLPGIEREILLEKGKLVERSVAVGDLLGAEAVATVSSVRGWRAAAVTGATVR